MKIGQLILGSIIVLMRCVFLPAATPSEHALDISDSVIVTPRQTPESIKAAEPEELVLGEIEIKGKVEKPGVYVMPKRIEPEIEDMELGRSFQNELKDGTNAVPRPENKISEVDEISSIKKAVKRKRN